MPCQGDVFIFDQAILCPVVACGLRIYIFRAVIETDREQVPVVVDIYDCTAVGLHGFRYDFHPAIVESGEGILGIVIKVGLVKSFAGRPLEFIIRLKVICPGAFRGILCVSHLLLPDNDRVICLVRHPFRVQGDIALESCL